MKLRHQTKLPPLQLRLTVPGELMQKLDLYRTYQQETAHAQWEVKELATEILRAFLEEGDRGFLVWCRHRGNGVGNVVGSVEPEASLVDGRKANASVSSTARNA